MDIADLHLHWGSSQYKGKTYRSYSLARPIRLDGKNRKETVVPLGRLSEDEAARWRSFLTAIKVPGAFCSTVNNLVVTKRFHFLDVAVANTVWDRWELDNVFKSVGRKSLDLALVARILSINRCIDPASKSQAPEWFRVTALPWMLDLDPQLFNSSRIFRELAAIESYKEAICQHLFKMMNRSDPDSMKSVFYDLSSTTFSGSRCVLMKWGHCKEGFENHVVLALVVNRDGLPFYWEVLPGGTADAKTIVWLLGRMKKHFEITQTTLVFDRGMVSDDNLTLLEEADTKYISAMDRSQIESITGLDFSTFSHLDPEKVDEQAGALPGFTGLGTNTYYREMKCEAKRRYILCFNPQLFRDQRKNRNQVLENFRSLVSNLNAELREAKRARQRAPSYKKFESQLVKKKLTDFAQVKLRRIHVKRADPDGVEHKIQTYQGEIEVDEKKMLSAGRLDGFWLLVTNHSEKEGDDFRVAAQDAVLPYREKIVIEAAFRDIKSFIEIAPIFVWKKEHVCAHYTLCVLSHLIDRTITLLLHRHPGDKTKNIVSHEKLYKVLSDCKIDCIDIENVGLSAWNMTRATPEQKELLDRLSMKRLLSCDVVEKAMNT